tara:strand:+ start:1011769 stop:1012269 length:501 start_codon:yes stop_codon:yes gene_type:complete
MRKPFAAFTLIELAVVMVVMGLLASLTVMSFGGTMDRYRLGKAVEAVERFDAYIRRESRSSQRSNLAAIDRRSGNLSLVSGDQRRTRMFRIPRRVEIVELTVIDAGGRRRSPSGVTNFVVTGSGRTPTYALHLQRGKYHRWLVVLGFSGQVVSLENAGEVDALLAT